YSKTRAEGGRVRSRVRSTWAGSRFQSAAPSSPLTPPPCYRNRDRAQCSDARDGLLQATPRTADVNCATWCLMLRDTRLLPVNAPAPRMGQGPNSRPCTLCLAARPMSSSLRSRLHSQLALLVWVLPAFLACGRGLLPHDVLGGGTEMPRGHLPVDD